MNRSDEEMDDLVRTLTMAIPDPNPILTAMKEVLKDQEVYFVNYGESNNYLITVDRRSLGAIEFHEDMCTIKMKESTRKFIYSDPSFDIMAIVEEIRSKAKSLRGEEHVANDNDIREV